MDPIEALRIRGIGGGKKPTGNAMPADVRTGKTYSSTQGYDLSGTMPVRSTVAQTVTPTTLNITKSAGIYDGDITIQGDVNLVGGNIVLGKTIFGVSGTFNAKKVATGTATSSNTTLPFIKGDNTTFNTYYLEISGLTFTPNVILIEGDDPTYRYIDASYWADNTVSGAKLSLTRLNNYIWKVTSNSYVNGTGFRLPTELQNTPMKWIAYE